MRAIRLALSLLLLSAPLLCAQGLRVSGRVTDARGEPLAGVRVEERGAFNTATSDVQGRYEISYSRADALLRFSHPGYQEVEIRPGGVPTLNVKLSGGVAVEGVLVVGTRRSDRSVLETPVPIDVIDVSRAVPSSGQLDLNQLLQQVVPAFNSNRQSGADGADHIDPASLRGLGPDQTLVLVNGKRRHQSSLINIFGSRGRGNTGTDLNAIPMAAIERIEVLRDGASAQYGSDAIAGVINIVLKSTADELTASLATGTNNARPPGSAPVLRDQRFDGFQAQAAANYGVRVGAGFLNLTGEYLDKHHTNRPVDPRLFSVYRRQFGDAALRSYATFLNARYPLSGKAALYAFGGYDHRATDAFAWTRDPDSDRNVPALYPNGFDPVIQSKINDGSASAGLAARVGAWDVDLNDTFGVNRFHYLVDHTLNASLLELSPTHFDAGGFQLAQNTTGVNVTRFFPSVMAGLNLALGTELRVDSYRIFAGEEGSYRNYGVRDTVLGGVPTRVDVLGRPGGSQGFPGFQPSNVLDRSRTNLGGYLDAELELTPRLMLEGAARYERYSDFGGTLNEKVAARYRLSDAVSFRASAGNGFRAPSLAQVYFNSTFTDVVAGRTVDKIIARNDSPIAGTLGIPPLREEKAVNFSAGLTARAGDFRATIDGYRVNVRDRIVITGAFESSDADIGAELAAAGVSAVQFFTNALDTRTKGVDVVLDWGRQLGPHQLHASLAGNFNDMKLGAVHTSPRLQGKENVYFGAREQHFLLASAPPSKIALGLQDGFRRVQADLRVVRYGRIVLIDFTDAQDVYRARATLDLSLTYRLTPALGLTLGGTNLLNRYPSDQDTDTETGGLWDAVQMGSNGAFYFARVSVHP